MAKDEKPRVDPATMAMDAQSVKMQLEQLQQLQSVAKVVNEEGFGKAASVTRQMEVFSQATTTQKPEANTSPRPQPEQAPRKDK